VCELRGVRISSGNINEALLYYTQCISYSVNLLAVGGHQVKCANRLGNGMGDSSAARVEIPLNFASELLNPGLQLIALI